MAMEDRWVVDRWESESRKRETEWILVAEVGFSTWPALESGVERILM